MVSLSPDFAVARALLMRKKTLLLALTALLVALDMQAAGRASGRFMRQPGFYTLAPNITLRLDEVGENKVRYYFSERLDGADGSIHTQTVDATYDTGGDPYFFFWDRIASTLWIASSNTAILYVVKEHQKPGDLVTGIAPRADFQRSPRVFQDEVRRRFPENPYVQKAAFHSFP